MRLLRIQLFISALLFQATLGVLAAEFDPFVGPKPLVVFIQTDPWAMVMGADTPRVAAYEDGTVVFIRISGKNATYQSKNLSATELSNLKKQLAPTMALKNLKSFYNLRPYDTDQPEAMFYIRDGERELASRVYGLTAEGKRSSHNVSQGKREADAVPDEIIELHKFLCAVDYPDSKEWTPRYLELMIWPYEYAPEASIKWPKDWPGLDSKRTFKRGDSYSIFLDGKVLPELLKFLKTRKEKGAVEIAGKKWAVSFRPVFPSEPAWRKTIEKPQEK